ncbi:maleylpyruvate isomerase N-terminal domain-containing protein [Streptomyces chiangmaiensis]|uniref:Maleylpyruvate isomerase N-terminal domain-containing protein n=1 Tax=Streptomyces chiangmaiensis TaxID=766497 RepID=A0ABU7FSL0_9ACTN|nr:maleylpyruvate isomerase N-terminal domain-containing protein [Streptomyces chiangmaiensis]MED7827100.1 maleylpyruvate isomerase N-terminal domain-containing protein [Streptomyces chiangmaiensis]
MNQDRVLEAFRLEAGELSQAVAGLSEAEWNLPTRCEPWSARELLGHVRVVIAWLPGMLDAPPPDKAEVSAVEYYRPDDRFAPQTNTARIALAQDHAAGQAGGVALADDFSATWQRVDRLCRAEPEARVVRTRHGDAMLLSQFLVTRVVEVAVHGLDLAEALEREPWLTPQAADVVLDLVLGPDRMTAAMLELGWNQTTFVRKATGREPLGVAETAQVERLGIRWLTLG